MAASYPVSLKVFTPVVDGEVIYGAHVNTLQEEIAAIQAELGTDPSGTSYTSVKARIAAVETGYSTTGHLHDHNALSNLTVGDPHTQYMLKSLGTTKGDTLAFSGSGVPVRVGVGANNTVLMAASGQTAGVQFTALDHGTHLAGLGDDDHPQYVLKSLGTTKGDILTFTAAGTPARQAAGANGSMVLADSAQTNGIRYGNNPILTGYQETIVDLGTTGGTVNIDLSLGNIFTITPNAAVTITVTNLPAAGLIRPVTLIIANSTYAFSWPAGTKYPNGAAPTLAGETWLSIVARSTHLTVGQAWKSVA